MSNKILRITSVTSLFGEYTVQRKKNEKEKIDAKCVYLQQRIA